MIIYERESWRHDGCKLKGSPLLWRPNWIMKNRSGGFYCIRCRRTMVTINALKVGWRRERKRGMGR